MTNRTALIIAVVIVLIFVALQIPQIQNIESLGFGARGDIATAEYQWSKTLWDWMDLLIVPALLGGIAIWFNEQTRRRNRTNEEDRFREDALQKYFDSMAALMLRPDTDKAKLSTQARNVAELRTITVLRRLNLERMQEVVNFLRDSDLLKGGDSILSGARLIQMDLAGLDLTLATLKDTALSESDLSALVLVGADLTNADLTLTTLSDANLNGANLTNADLTGADLTRANLTLANLRSAYLNGAVLHEADLTEANLTNAILDDALFDERTVLPDGMKWTPGTDMRRFTDPTSAHFWTPL
jgi:uncharacterized protein YjbI with pentapeptide repeats